MTSAENGASSEDEKMKEVKKKRHKRNDHSTDTIVTAALKQLNADEIETMTSDCADCLEPPVKTQPVFRNYPSDMVYVERKKGFSPASREKALSRTRKINFNDQKDKNDGTLAVESALKIQRAFRPFFNFCHGILAGISLMYCLLTVSVGSSRMQTDEFVNVYGGFDKIVQSLFYFLTAVCAVSALERCDVAEYSDKHLRKLCPRHFPEILLVLLCVLTLGTTLATSYWDGQLTLHVHNTTRALEDATHRESSIYIWRNLNFSRCIGAIGSWIIASLYPDGGLFDSHLAGILKLKLKRMPDTSVTN